MTELTEKQKEQMRKVWRENFYGSLRSVDFEGFSVGYTAAVNRECVWSEASAGMACFYETPCGSTFDFLYPFCPNCGGKVVEENEKAQAALKGAEEVNTEK